jgi:hypothetical protein
VATDAEIAAAALEALKDTPGVKSVSVGPDGSRTVVYKDNSDIIEAAQFAEQRTATSVSNFPVRRVAIGVTSGIRSCD